MRKLQHGLVASLLLIAACPQPGGPVKPGPNEPGTPTSRMTPEEEQAAFGPGPGGGGSKNAPGQFDFYVLSLSWSPQHCATRGKQLGPDDPQCGGSAAYGFIVHGLWPQFQHGYPESCAVSQELDANLVKRIMRIMPSEKLIRHEWEKHGTCSGLPAEEYFSHAEQLMGGLKMPDRYAAPKEVTNTSVAALRQELTAANPSLPKDGTSLAVVCSGEYLQELRLCYSKDFQPQPCTGEVHDTCSSNLTVRPLINKRTP